MLEIAKIYIDDNVDMNKKYTDDSIYDFDMEADIDTIDVI